ncbi:MULTISPECIES: helix-turn-helix transcriptional regulator [unclassified Undibacterium]|uniref:helix-turn-helix transcriptional regulator n=1 Tax=unclassified Undibacterium TaxID=2630295 RepID=UPI003C2D0A1A
MESTAKKFIRLRRVLEIMPVSRSTWYAGINSGRFPKPFKIGPRAVAWLQSDIDKLVESLCLQSDRGH